DPGVARATIGRLGDDELGGSGLEKTLDTLLAGRSGAAVVLKDRAGREYESPARVIAPPVPGLDVVLTLDAELQEIAQRALDDALRRMDADGGDVVMLDPGTGDVLALASRQRDGSARPSAFTDTFEPGSLAKIFAAAALLSLRRVSPTDRVSGEGGKWRVLGRTITDDDPQPSLTWPTRSASRATSPSPSSRRGSRRRSSTRCCGTSGLERSLGSSFPRRPRDACDRRPSGRVPAPRASPWATSSRSRRSRWRWRTGR